MVKWNWTKNKIEYDLSLNIAPRVTATEHTINTLKPSKCAIWVVVVFLLIIDCSHIVELSYCRIDSFYFLNAAYVHIIKQRHREDWENVPKMLLFQNVVSPYQIELNVSTLRLTLERANCIRRVFCLHFLQLRLKFFDKTRNTWIWKMVIFSCFTDRSDRKGVPWRLPRRSRWLVPGWARYNRSDAPLWLGSLGCCRPGIGGCGCSLWSDWSSSVSVSLSSVSSLPGGAGRRLFTWYNCVLRPSPPIIVTVPKPIHIGEKAFLAAGRIRIMTLAPMVNSTRGASALWYFETLFAGRWWWLILVFAVSYGLPGSSVFSTALVWEDRIPGGFLSGFEGWRGSEGGISPNFVVRALVLVFFSSCTLLSTGLACWWVMTAVIGWIWCCSRNRPYLLLSKTVPLSVMMDLDGPYRALWCHSRGLLLR